MTRRLLVFPLAWFVGLLVIDYCFTLIDSLLPKPSLAEFIGFLAELYVGVAWGALSYAIAEFLLNSAAPRFRGKLWAVGFVASVILVFAGPIMTYGSARAFAYDPIGVANDAGDPPCPATDVVQRSNNRGLVATVREVHCIGDWDEPSTYFVFVNRADKVSTTNDLVLRYRGEWEGDRWGRPASVEWQGPDALFVRVDGKVEQITERRSEISGVAVEYRIRRPDCPSALNSWQRLLWSWFKRFVWC